MLCTQVTATEAWLYTYAQETNVINQLTDKSTGVCASTKLRGYWTKVHLIFLLNV